MSMIKNFDVNVLGKIIEKLNISVTVSDPNIEDNPLVYVNEGFTETTGYDAKEVIGRNCRFLQGEKTNRETVRKIKKDVMDITPFTTEILNYRKDGTPFWNELNVYPIFGNNGDVRYFVGVQRDVTAKKESEILLRENMDLAKKIQTGFLPKKIDDVRIFIEGEYIPCDDLGGDLYFWTKLNESQYSVFLLDVMGHGVSSALVGTAIRSTFIDIITTESDLGKVMQKVNDQMNQLFADMDYVTYFTAITLLIDVEKKVLKYVNAGHPPGIYVNSTNDVNIIESDFPPVGLLQDIEYKEKEIAFDSNSRILLYTDGFLTEEDIKTNVIKLNNIVNKNLHKDDVTFLSNVVKEHMQNTLSNDDITVVSIHLK